MYCMILSTFPQTVELNILIGSIYIYLFYFEHLSTSVLDAKLHFSTLDREKFLQKTINSKQFCVYNLL